jgi:hypothetical protein
MEKSIFTLAMILTFSTFTFAGPITSNGPQGRLLLQCRHETTLPSGGKVTLILTVRPVLKKGIVASITTVDVKNNKIVGEPFSETVTKENDNEDVLYKGKSLEILATPTAHAAILTFSDLLGEGESVLMKCQAP